MSEEAWPQETVAALNEFYGDPRGSNGIENPEWEAANIVMWTPPYPMFYSDGARSPLRHMRVHKKCLAAFDAAFRDVLAKLGLAYIVEHRLDISGGSFNYRVERGGTRLSVHSWGAAIDMDPGHNPFPHAWQPDGKYLDLKFVDILKSHGFFWRGDRIHGDDDPMHLQLCSHVYGPR